MIILHFGYTVAKLQKVIWALERIMKSCSCMKNYKESFVNFIELNKQNLYFLFFCHCLKTKIFPNLGEYSNSGALYWNLITVPNCALESYHMVVFHILCITTALLCHEKHLNNFAKKQNKKQKQNISTLLTIYPNLATL